MTNVIDPAHHNHFDFGKCAIKVNIDLDCVKSDDLSIGKGG